MRKMWLLIISLALILGCVACDDATILNDSDRNNLPPFNHIASDVDEGLLFEFIGVDSECTEGYCLKIHLENLSSVQTYWVDIESIAANGVQGLSYFEAVVKPGRELNTDLILYDVFLEMNNVGVYTDIEVTYCVYDNEEMLNEPLFQETIHYYPHGEELATTFVREPQDTDIVLADNDLFTVIATRYEEDPILGHNVHLYFVNKSDKWITFSAEDPFVNGIEIYSLWAVGRIDPGKCGFSRLHWNRSEMFDHGIESVDEIQFTLFVYDEDTFLDGLYNEVITIQP